VLFCPLGLVILTGMMKYFANLGAIIANYNQFLAFTSAITMLQNLDR
jgi:hypothetical protein